MQLTLRMSSQAPAPAEDQRSHDFYRHALTLLGENGVPFLVGGAFAFARYTGIERDTKDFDLFLRREDFERAAAVLENAGYETDLAFSHWLGKAFHGDAFIDLIFSSGNGVARVDEAWFDYAVPGRVLGLDVRLIPAEEMIWSKGLIMERERFDGADVAHLIRAVGKKLDWQRVLDRFGPHWRPLYAHLILFGFIYPEHRSAIPEWVMAEFASRLSREVGEPDPDKDVCNGTILSRQQYLVDIDRWGYRDARLKPAGNLTSEQIADWTAGIDQDG